MYTKQQLDLLVTTTKSNGFGSSYGHAKITLGYNYNGEQMNFGYLGSYYGDERRYVGLGINAQRNCQGGTVESPSWYGWSNYSECPVAYEDVSGRIGTEVLALQLKTLRSIEKKWKLLDDQLGECRRLSDAAVRFGTIMKVVSYKWTDGNVSQMSGEYWRSMTAQTIISKLDSLESFDG